MAVDDDSAPSHDCTIRDHLLLWAAFHSGSCAVSLSGPVEFATGWWVARCPRLSQSTQRASELWLTERVVCVLHLQPWKEARWNGYRTNRGVSACKKGVSSGGATPSTSTRSTPGTDLSLDSRCLLFCFVTECWP